MEYPLNLINAIFENEEAAENIDSISDYRASVEYAVNLLTEREIKVIKMRFEEGINLTQAGAALGVTRERVRQIEVKALRKLRHPSRAIYIKYGVKGAFENWKHDYLMKYAELEASLIGLCELNKKEAAKIITDESIIHKSHLRDFTLEQLGLSCRSYNCMKRAGFNTLYEIHKAVSDNPDFWYVGIRNLGRKSIDEITHTLKEYGCDF